MTEAWTDDAAENIPGESTDDIPGDTEQADQAGIPDEPEVFVEELEADDITVDTAQDGADVPETGEPRVDEVLSGLAGIENRPTSEHVGVYDQVHRGLQDALANLDQG